MQPGGLTGETRRATIDIVTATLAQHTEPVERDVSDGVGHEDDRDRTAPLHALRRGGDGGVGVAYLDRVGRGADGRRRRRGDLDRGDLATHVDGGIRAVADPHDGRVHIGVGGTERYEVLPDHERLVAHGTGGGHGRHARTNHVEPLEVAVVLSHRLGADHAQLVGDPDGRAHFIGRAGFATAHAVAGQCVEIPFEIGALDGGHGGRHGRIRCWLGLRLRRGLRRKGERGGDGREPHESC